jgi:hypothetical protein
VHGDPAALARALARDPVVWLPDAEAADDDRWWMTVHGAGLSRTVLASVGAPWASATTTWRSISWEAVRETDAGDRARLLPAFDGEVGVVTASPGASLVLEGRYLPPGGQLGAALDGLALHRVARGTADRLLADIGAALTAQVEPANEPSAAATDDAGRR